MRKHLVVPPRVRLLAALVISTAVLTSAARANEIEQIQPRSSAPKSRPERIAGLGPDHCAGDRGEKAREWSGQTDLGLEHRPGDYQTWPLAAIMNRRSARLAAGR